MDKNEYKIQTVVLARDGSKYEGGSQGQTVLLCMLQYESAFSDVMFHNQAYVQHLYSKCPV